MRTRSKARGWRRHVDGWQAGAILLLIAGSAILLATPRAVAPEDVPVPTIDARALAVTMAADDAHAEKAEAQRLDVDVRAVGRELRLFNEAAATGQQDEMREARRRLLQQLGIARRHQTDPLLQLRAVQMKHFLVELRRWQQTGEDSAELRALGGDFLAMLKRNRWCRGESRELVLGERELRVLYKKRWNDIVGVGQPPFALTLDENRTRFLFLIRHPFILHRDAELSRLDTAGGKLRTANARLRSIERLTEIDPTYPAEIARGVVRYQVGRYALAAEHFRRHLENDREGAHTLRVQNYLKASLDMASDMTR